MDHRDQVDHRELVDNHNLVDYSDWVAHSEQVDHRDRVDQTIWCVLRIPHHSDQRADGPETVLGPGEDWVLSLHH